MKAHFVGKKFVPDYFKKLEFGVEISAIKQRIKRSLPDTFNLKVSAINGLQMQRTKGSNA